MEFFIIILVSVMSLVALKFSRPCVPFGLFSTVHVLPTSVPPNVVQSADKLTEHKILIVIDESRILGLFIFDFLEVVGGGSGICHYSSI
ncbi:hypothetical protein [Campylobacter lanienae]|uniref:hypothetical protein n=1 Tax=Campylobacter lanienae TaxID=75658 RepID=UPI00112FA5D0|nr:hypothetical protein [Campylobacter lanienae]